MQRFRWFRFRFAMMVTIAISTLCMSFLGRESSCCIIVLVVSKAFRIHCLIGAKETEDSSAQKRDTDRSQRRQTQNTEVAPPKKTTTVTCQDLTSTSGGLPRDVRQRQTAVLLVLTTYPPTPPSGSRHARPVHTTIVITYNVLPQAVGHTWATTANWLVSNTEHAKSTETVKLFPPTKI